MRMFKRDKIEKYDQIFVPGAPVKQRRHLVGREQEITDLKNILRRPGQHAVVIGDRGVGKTSLVKHVLADLKYQILWRNCDPLSSFRTLFRDALEEGGAEFLKHEETTESKTEGTFEGAPLGIGARGKIEQKHSTKSQDLFDKDITPWTIFKALEGMKAKIVLVLDEYDAVHDSGDDFHKSTAYTIKHLSDHSDLCDSRIVVVGVANSSQELLGKHESIQRCAREIYLRPLARRHIIEFLETTEVELGFQFEDRVKERLVDGSLGYPFYVHLVGLECVEAMLQRDQSARTVTWNDFKKGVSKAVDQAFRAELNRYKNMIFNSSKHEKIVIYGLASIDKNHPKRDELRRYVVERYDIDESSFDSALLSLAQQKKFFYMSRRTDHVRFMDPLMKAFLREKLRTGDTDKFKSPSQQLELFSAEEDSDHAYEATE